MTTFLLIISLAYRLSSLLKKALALSLLFDGM